VLDFLGLVLAKLTHDVVSLRILLFAMVDRSAYSCISLRCSSRSKSSMCHFWERRPAARRVGKLMSEVRAGDPGASASQSSKGADLSISDLGSTAFLQRYPPANSAR